MSWPVAGGYYHTIALGGDGIVRALGYNGYGQLGDGTTTDRHSPIQVPDFICVLWNLTVQKTGGVGIVSSAPSGINCGTDCIGSYAAGASVTLTATTDPPSGSVFTGWSGGGCSGTGTCTVTMDAPKTVTAPFHGQRSAHRHALPCHGRLYRCPEHYPHLQ